MARKQTTEALTPWEQKQASKALVAYVMGPEGEALDHYDKGRLLALAAKLGNSLNVALIARLPNA